MGSAFGGGGTSGSQNVYQLGGVPQFDQSYQNLVNSQIANNPYQTYAPQATATFNQAYNNPYASAYQTAANTAGTQYQTTGANAAAGATQAQNAGTQGMAAANQALNLAYDPQSALYNQLSQQSANTAAVNNAMSGVGTSPYGASVANNAATNFNIDWQNNQLQRALQGLSGYNSAVAGANSDFSNAANLGNTAAQAYTAAGQAPYSAANTITNDQTSALNNLLQVLGNQGSGAYTQSNLSDLMAYLGLGVQQSDTQAQINQQAQQAAQQGLGSLFSSLTSSSAGNPSLLSQGASFIKSL